MEIYKLLPKTNCRECGLPSCMSFAVKMLKNEVHLDDCPVLKKPEHIANRAKLGEMVAEMGGAKETKLIIYPELCNGCGNCVVACPANVSASLETSGGKGPITEEIISKVKDGHVVEIKLELCRRFEGDGDSQPCRICIEVCPMKAIEFV